MQKVAYRLAHNKLTINTGFDLELLKIDFDLNLTGFANEELDFSSEFSNRLLNRKGSNSDEWGKCEARCEPGQTWQLGRHKLHCGDSTNLGVVKKLLHNVTLDNLLIWSDPPYGITCQHKDGSIGAGSAKYPSKKYPVIVGDKTTDAAIASFELCQKLLPSATQIWWGANHYSGSCLSAIQYRIMEYINV